MTKEREKKETSGEKNFRLYEVYISTLTDDDLKQMQYQGGLNKTELAQAIGISKSSLTQNTNIRRHVDLHPKLTH